MSERGMSPEPGFGSQDVWLNPFDRMRSFVKERTQGFDPVDVVQFQQFGHINVRINQLDQQVGNSIVRVDYFLGSESPLEINAVRVDIMEAKGWISLLGRIANGIDKNLLPRIASSVNIPIIHFANEDGQTAETFTRKISEAQAEALAAILGTTIANLFGSGLAETT